MENKLSDGLDSLGNTFSNGLSKIIDFIKDIPEYLINLKNSIVGGFKDIGNFILDIPGKFKELFIYLFVPEYNPVSEIKNKISDKFNFVTQMVSLSADLFKDFDSNAVPPSFSISYMGGTYEIINFEILKPYRATIHGIIIAICWIEFVLWFFKFAPKIIKGGG